MALFPKVDNKNLETYSDVNHPHASTNAHNLYETINNPYTWIMLHVSFINCCPKGDVIQRHTKPSHPIYNLHVKWMCCFHRPMSSVSLRMEIYCQNTQENSCTWVIATTCRRIQVYGLFIILNKLCVCVGVYGWLQSHCMEQIIWNYSNGSAGLSCSVPVDNNSSHGFCGQFHYTHVTHSTDLKFSESDNIIGDKLCKYIKKIQNIRQKVL